MKHFSLSLLVFEIFDWITSDGPPCIVLIIINNRRLYYFIAQKVFVQSINLAFKQRSLLFSLSLFIFGENVFWVFTVLSYIGILWVTSVLLRQSSKMSRKSRETSEEEQKIIIKLHNQCKSFQEVAQLMDRPWSTIQSIIDRFCERKTMQNIKKWTATSFKRDQ